MKETIRVVDLAKNDNLLRMRNIFILPTDKPSNLYKTDRLYKYINGVVREPLNCINQNIYITSNEEIKLGDWCINIAHNVVVKPTDLEWANSNKDNLKKIILTTDQDLIADRVEEISEDELLKIIKDLNNV